MVPFPKSKEAPLSLLDSWGSEGFLVLSAWLRSTHKPRFFLLGYLLYHQWTSPCLFSACFKDPRVQPLGATRPSPLTSHTVSSVQFSQLRIIFFLYFAKSCLTPIPTLVEKPFLSPPVTLYLYIEAFSVQTWTNYLTCLSLFCHQKNSFTGWVSQKANFYMITVQIY